MVVPDQYMCSITSEIMIDPSLPACLAYTPLPFDATSLHRAHPLRSTHYRRKQVDDFTYERSATEQWLETHNTSPATGVELQSKQLNPNHSTRSLIQYIRKAGDLWARRGGRHAVGAV